ncbi:MAG TPA: hypothetical protein VE258_10725 [Ktedonobacterales bacterium]|nr:hypothetical protein [Ktedonobacterales bacterium]
MAAGQARRTARRGRWPAAALLACAALALLLAGCSASRAGQQTAPAATQTATSSGPTATPRSTAPPSPTAVQITDLGAFRQKLSTSYTSNHWENVNPLLSPNFSFQGTDSGGAQLVMPASAHDLKQLFTSEGAWTQAPDWQVANHKCFAGATPVAQQMGFDGDGGSFVLLGVERWQGYWVVAWAFQDPLGGYNACASE